MLLLKCKITAIMMCSSTSALSRHLCHWICTLRTIVLNMTHSFDRRSITSLMCMNDRLSPSSSWITNLRGIMVDALSSRVLSCIRTGGGYKCGRGFLTNGSNIGFSAMDNSGYILGPWVGRGVGSSRHLFVIFKSRMTLSPQLYDRLLLKKPKLNF